MRGIPFYLTATHAQRQERLSGWRAMLALIGVALLTGCGAAGHAGKLAKTLTTAAPVSTAAPTATTLPTPVVTTVASGGDPVAGNAPYWQAAMLPTGFGDLFHFSTVALSASDGMTAYACSVLSALTPQGAAGSAEVITTHDRGLNWSAPVTLPFQANSCTGVFVDQLNAANAVVLDDNGTDEYITKDGGQSWSRLAIASGYQLGAFAIVGARTYALVSSGGQYACLAQSDDQMRTWRCIDASLSATLGQTHYPAFWVNPASGALLLESQIPSGGVDLWHSENDGQTWAPVNIPVPTGDVLDIAVQQPSAAQPWRLCALNFTLDEVFCTTASGATWTQEPQFWPNDGNSAQFISLVGLPGDGSLIIMRNTGSDPTLYRLPAGATRWQNLGAAAPPTGGTSFESGATGVLWAVPAESDGAATPDQPNEFYSASYPY